MEDSGIESDSKPMLNGKRTSAASLEEAHGEGEDSKSDEFESPNPRNDSPAEEVLFVGITSGNKDVSKTATRFMPSSVLQKRLEKQILQTRKLRQREQNLEGIQKKLIPRNRLKVPRSQVPIVTKTDSHPLVSWESDSDDEIDYHPISKSATKEITEQLIKDGYNLDLTPDDEDLDLIPPKPLTHRCVCCSMSCMCLIQ